MMLMPAIMPIGETLKVTIPTDVDGGGSTTTITTPSVSATVTGGSGSYIYAWSKVSGDAITAVSPTAAATTFRSVSQTSGTTRIAYFIVTVTDTVTGQTAVSNQILVRIERF